MTEILNLLENHHIRKVKTPSDTSHPFKEAVQNMLRQSQEQVQDQSVPSIMNEELKMEEVKGTFLKNKGSPGPDKVTANLLDKADRGTIAAVLLQLFNKAWNSGQFPQEWKLEHRAVFPKSSDADLHEEKAYRTVSLTSIIGKRFESITAKRLISVMEGLGFDPTQFAYLQNRSSTQAIMIAAERIKRSLMEGGEAGAVFFDFSDAFGSVDRSKLLYKIGKDFKIKGKLFLHLHDFLSNRHARMKVGDAVGSWIVTDRLCFNPKQWDLVRIDHFNALCK